MTLTFLWHFHLVILFVNPHQTLRLLILVGRRGQIRLHNTNMGSNWNQSTTIRYNRGYCCQTPFEKTRKGVGQHGRTLHHLCALYSACQSDCRIQLRHIRYIRDEICAQVVVVAAFDNAVMLLRERMGSKKLLLKQREAVEAFMCGRVSVFRPATVRTFATVA